MYKYEFELKQVTPMIHFQHDEEGATLRSTEVKPKLDKFLWYCIKEKRELKDIKGLIEELEKEYLKNKENILLKQGENKLPNYLYDFNDDEKNAFRYSLRIFTQENPNIDMKINAMYFGNIGKNTKKKKTIFYENSIDCRIVADSKSLINLIKQILPAFFLLHNFGTRQSKGFGGFIIKNKNNKENICEDEIIKKFSKYNFLKLSGDVLDTNYSYEKYSYKMELARWLYALMKGGVNGDRSNLSKGEKEKIPYFKGFISVYFIERQIGNEKSKIKKEILSFDQDNNFKKNNLTNKMFVRALLGLSENYFFSHDENGNRTGKKMFVKISHKNGKKEEKIQRYQSPLLIKITDDNLFIIACDDSKEIMNKKFEFYNKEKRKSFLISVPSNEDAQISKNSNFQEIFLEAFSIFFETIKAKKIENFSNMALKEIKEEEYLILKELSNFDLKYIDIKKEEISK